MDDHRIGRSLRALRRRRGWRQLDVASASGVAQTTVSLIERGHWTSLSVRIVRRVFASVDASFDGIVGWRGGSLDRLLDQRHTALVERVVAELTTPAGKRPSRCPSRTTGSVARSTSWRSTRSNGACW